MSNRAQLFVGRLPKDVRKTELERVFNRYGRVTRCDIRTGLETAYAFVDFDDHRDAKEALKSENGRDMHGQRMVVDWAIDDYKYGRTAKRGYRDRRSSYPRHYSRSRSRSRSRTASPGRDNKRHGRTTSRTSKSRSRSRSRENNGQVNRSSSRDHYRSRSKSR